ncbi:hypothetical protein ACLKA6_002102 [Drosophila palustris]
MKRQRCANFTPEEEAELVALVKANQSVLENKKSDAITWKQKPSGWEKLATGVQRTVSALKAKYEANTIIQELVLATSAYRTAAVAKNPFSVRRSAPVDNSPHAMITSPPPAKRQCNEAPFNIYVFGLKEISNFVDEAIFKVGNGFRSRLGAKAAIIFSCETEPTFKAMEDLPRGQKEADETADFLEVPCQMSLPIPADEPDELIGEISRLKASRLRRH